MIKCLRETLWKRKYFISAHSFRSFGTQPLAPLILDLWWERQSWWKEHVTEATHGRQLSGRAARNLGQGTVWGVCSQGTSSPSRPLFPQLTTSYSLVKFWLMVPLFRPETSWPNCLWNNRRDSSIAVLWMNLAFWELLSPVTLIAQIGHQVTPLIVPTIWGLRSHPWFRATSHTGHLSWRCLACHMHLSHRYMPSLWVWLLKGKADNRLAF